MGEMIEFDGKREELGEVPFDREAYEAETRRLEGERDELQRRSILWAKWTCIFCVVTAVMVVINVVVQLLG